MIHLENVSKTYQSRSGAVHALNGVSLEVQAGEFVSVIGPSGCGKTTLLKVVAGLEQHDEGVVRVAGHDVQGPAADRVAIVFQNFALLPWETVLGNVTFVLKARGLSKTEMVERARDALNSVGLSGFERHYPHELSGGMQQRVGLARALSVDTEVLLMDEPFGAVDAQTRRILQDDLLELWQKSRKTVLFITHAMDEAVLLGDRVVIMKPRPARVHEVFEVPFGRPRDGRELMGDPEFSACQNHIWHALEESARESELVGRDA